MDQYLMDDINKWKAVYRLLDRVSTLPSDCGKLCGSACCTCLEQSFNNERMRNMDHLPFSR